MADSNEKILSVGKNANDTYELPDGRQFPKQCFWLNNTYIYDQLNEELK